MLIRRIPCAIVSSVKQYPLTLKDWSFIMTYQKKNLSRILAAVLALVLVAACGVVVSTSAAAAGARSHAASAESPAGDGDSVIS